MLVEGKRCPCLSTCSMGMQACERALILSAPPSVLTADQVPPDSSVDGLARSCSRA
jgi:hypothetical protein